MLTVITGNMGSGKTLLSTILAAHTNPQTRVFSNYQLRLPNYTALEPELLMEKETKGLIIIDEAYVWLESRTSGNRANRYLSYILYQSRKKGFNFILTIQNISALEKRFREQADTLVICRNNQLAKRFEYFIYRKDFINYTRAVRYLPWKKAEPYFRLYETTEVVNPPTMKKLSFAFVMSDDEKLNALIEKASAELQPVCGDAPTKDEVERELIRLEYPREITKYVYAQLRKNKQKRKYK